KTVELLAPYSVKVTTQKVDVAKRDEVATWAKAVVDEHGQVNLIFNNAGVAIGSTAEGVSYEDLEWLIGINFWGVGYG
ncbi:SDR family NAD(P)-dependent oxidoreductase, partial [Acinetobacter baumannii]